MRFNLILFYMIKQRVHNLMKCGALFKIKAIKDGFGSQLIIIQEIFQLIPLVNENMKFSESSKQFLSLLVFLFTTLMTGVVIRANYPLITIKQVNETLKLLNEKNLTLRTRIKRLTRKSICFSKTQEMHDIVIGIVINILEFGWCVNLWKQRIQNTTVFLKIFIIMQP